MLTHLLIRNYALIRQLEFNPSPHLNAITGETGAGKSIMLGAIGLLTGNRADTRVLWDDQEKCVIEGVFDIRAYQLQSFFEEEGLDYAHQTIIRREINPAGKSRAFVNDSPVTLEVMKRLGSRLMDIHSQHETLELGNLKFQLRLIDAFAGHDELLSRYADAWKNFEAARLHLQHTRQTAQSLRQEADYIQFQLEELNRAGLQPDEQEKCEAELKIMEHAEEIKSKLKAVLDVLSTADFAALSSLRQARQLLQSIAGYATEYNHLLDRLTAVQAELDDVARELEHLDSRVEYDPQRASQLADRLDVIYRLQQKYRVHTVAELLEMQHTLQQKSMAVTNIDEALAEAERTYSQAEEELKQAAGSLSASRQKHFDPLCNELVKLLADLGMPGARLTIDHHTTAAGAHGIDRIELMFSANKGMPLRPLNQVASGGEFSRLMFAVKYVMAERTEMPTLILDEIDTGVSGETAHRLGRLMQLMARKHQLIAITHLPQIAARADAHFMVFKETFQGRTTTDVRRLSNPQRVETIARMIDGDKPSAAALTHARELLQEAGQ
jgi:DNA repair protein RecN (Recombination protein N)